MCLLSLDTMLDTPNACCMTHSSTVHDQNRSECPETPKSWKVLPFSFVLGLRSFLLFLIVSLSLLSIPDAIRHDQLLIMSYGGRIPDACPPMAIQTTMVSDDPGVFDS